MQSICWFGTGRSRSHSLWCYAVFKEDDEELDTIKPQVLYCGIQVSGARSRCSMLYVVGSGQACSESCNSTISACTVEVAIIFNQCVV